MQPTSISRSYWCGDDDPLDEEEEAEDVLLGTEDGSNGETGGV